MQAAEFEEDEGQHESRDAGSVSTHLHNPLCERIGGVWIWGKAITRTRAAVWASAEISGPVLSGGARSPTIYEEGKIIIFAGGSCGGRRW